MDTSIIIAASAVVWPAATYMFGRRHGGWYARQEIRKLKNGIACRDRKLSEAQGRIDIRNMWLDRRNKRIIELLAELAAAGKPDQPRDPITGRWMSKPTPDDGWIEWKGGERPVSSIDAVDVKFRSGGKAADNAGNFYWGHDHMSSDIIAYRIASREGGGVMDRFPFVTLLLAVIAAVVIIGAISLGVMTFWDWVFPDSSRLAALGYFGTYLGGILAIGLAIDLRRKP